MPIIKVKRKTGEIIHAQLVNPPASIRNVSEWLNGAVGGVLDTLRILTTEHGHFLNHLGRPRDQVYVSVE